MATHGHRRFERLRARSAAGWSPTSPPAIRISRAPPRHPAWRSSGGRGRPRGRRAVLGSARRRPGDPARHRTGARGRDDAARRARHARPTSAHEDRRADRALHIRQPDPADGLRHVRGRARATAGVDGVLMLDMPLEEAESCARPWSAAGIDTIFLLSPTTSGRSDSARRRNSARLSLWHLAARRHRRARREMADGRRRAGRAGPARSDAAGRTRLRHLAAGTRRRGRPHGPMPPWSAARSSA